MQRFAAENAAEASCVNRIAPMAARPVGGYIPPMPYSTFDPERRQRSLERLRRIPLRKLVPNVITLLALCAGLTGIRLALEGRYELALGAIVFAAMLDAVDGRVARMIKGTSRFGAELVSLADFFNFGVAPGLILYFWGLNTLGNLGWIAAMVFAICAALRLARFNVQIEDPKRPAWAGNFFTGVPAPPGAITVLLPIYLFFLQVHVPAIVTLAYTLAIAALMVSRLPVLSGKKMGNRVRPDMVLPLIVVVVLFVALLVSYPWHVLTVGTLAYLALLPLGWFSYQRHVQADAADAAAVAMPAAPNEMAPTPRAPQPDDERPARLN
jgi:CDP-diacylglycerol--serine O-phosphatidyltransferase